MRGRSFPRTTRPWLTGPDYIDPLGRKWSAGRLDWLLADYDVMRTVLSAVNVGLRPDHTWSPGAVFAWAKVRYPRECVAALLLVIVTRYFDTAGAHYLNRKSVA